MPKRKAPFFPKKKQNPQKKQKKGQASGSQKQDKSGVKCYKCGVMGHFANNCPQRQCYECHQTGHLKNNCPQLMKKKQAAKLNVMEGDPGPSQRKGKQVAVMEGMIPFRDTFIRILFDTGASHSFISTELVDRYYLEVVYLVTSLRVANPIGGSATLGMLCKGFELSLCGLSFLCDLHVFECLGFDIILGMDWLDRYDAQLSCSDRVVTLKHPSYKGLVNMTLDVLSSSAYVSLFSMESREEDEIARVPIVRDFGDIFEPVTGLPPKRAVEFRIDLILGA